MVIDLGPVCAPIPGIQVRLTYMYTTNMMGVLSWFKRPAPVTAPRPTLATSSGVGTLLCRAQSRMCSAIPHDSASTMGELLSAGGGTGGRPANVGFYSRPYNSCSRVDAYCHSIGELGREVSAANGDGQVKSGRRCHVNSAMPSGSRHARAHRRNGSNDRAGGRKVFEVSPRYRTR